MNAPSFRAVEQHSGFVATCRRMATEVVESAIVTVGEAFLRRLDHDYDSLLIPEGRMECDGPDAVSPLTSAVSASAADRPEVVSAGRTTTAPASGHLSTATTPPVAAIDPVGSPPEPAGSPLTVVPNDFPASGPLVIETLLVSIGKQHSDIYASPDGFVCSCRALLPADTTDLMATHLRHVSQIQAAAVDEMLRPWVMETGQDMGVGFASEMFPQHQKK